MARPSVPSLATATRLFCLVLRFINSFTIADGACEARSRSDEEAMLIHRRRIATTRAPATPIGPKGCGGVGPSRCSPLLGDERASPASRLRRSGPTALATMVQLFMRHDTSVPRTQHLEWSSILSLRGGTR